jgi:signal transduction histidine kinase
MWEFCKHLPGMQLFCAGGLRKLRLQTRFLLILGFAALCFSFAIWGVYTGIVDRMVTRIGTRLAEKQVLYDKARTLQPLIREVALARQMADTAAIQQWARNENDPKLRSAAFAEIEKFRKNFQDGSYFLALAGSGHYYFNDATEKYRGRELRYTLTPNQKDDAWFYATIKSQGEYHINVDPDTKLGVTKVWINVLLRDGKQVLGVLGTGLDLTQFIKEVADPEQLGVHNLFIDDNAAIQIHRDVQLINFSSIAKSNGQQISIDLLLDKPQDRDWVHQTIQQLKQGPHEIATQFIEMNGTRYLAGMAALPEIGWYDVTLLDLGILVPQRDFVKMGFAIGIAILGLLMILALVLDRLVLRPVNFLTEAASRIRHGGQVKASLSEATGELSEMTSRFFDMTDNLQSEKTALEIEVEKRTRQIMDAQKVLETALQQEKEGRLTQANLLAMIAHEIRNPVAVIGNTAQSLQALTESAQPDWLPRINKITAAVQRISLLLDNLLAEERMSEFHLGHEREPGDLGEYCRDITNSLSLIHGRIIRCEQTGEQANLWADWQLIGIAITNLIDNAIKYSPAASEIVLHLYSSANAKLCIEVSDKGSGIPLKMQERIFDKFKRGDGTTKTPGTGLGLYLVKWIALLHGGQVSLVASSEFGSTFRITLPVRAARR